MTDVAQAGKVMEYTRLGFSGLKISRIVISTMSFGGSSNGREHAC
jgi:aryl-alcohol dehydrogenase-like predicted oxidoreductase